MSSSLDELFGRSVGGGGGGAGGSSLDALFGGTTATAGPRRDIVEDMPEQERKKHHDHGLLATIAHVITQTPTDFKDMALGIPGGLMQIHRALAEADPTNLRHFGESDTTAVKAMGKGYAEALLTEARHPLRNPGNTFVDLVLPFASAGASTTLRLGAVARAAGEAGTAGEIARAALRAPSKGKTRIVTAPSGATAKGHYSRSSLGYLTQRTQDAALERMAGTEVGAGGKAETFLNKRIDKWTNRRIRVEQAIADRQVNALAVASAKITPVESRALRFAFEKLPVPARLNADIQRIEEAAGRVGNVPGADMRTVKRLEDREQWGRDALQHLELDPEGIPTLKRDTPEGERLGHIFDLMHTVYGDRESILKALDIMDEAALEGAKLKTGRFVLGAHWVNRTAAREGRSPRVLSERKRVASLQRRYDKLYEREQPGAITTRDRTLNRQQAEQHLAELQLVHDRRLKQIADAQFGPVDMREVSRRNVARGKAIKQAKRVNKSLTMRGFGAANLKLEPTVWDERFADAERLIAEQIERNPDHPVMQRWAAHMDEIARLQHWLSPDPEELFGGARLAKPEESAADRFRAQLAADPEGNMARYEAEHGAHIDTDLVRELSPEYAASKEARSALAASIHEPASDFAARLFERYLAREPQGRVTILGGGGGAGKSSALGDLRGSAEIVLDTTLSKLDSATRRIDQALASGRDVEVNYVYRDPIEALHAALARAERHGRPVPLREFVKAHAGSNKVIRELADRYAGNERVTIRAFVNETGKLPREVPVSELPKLSPKAVEKEVRDEFQREIEAGRVSERVQRGFGGSGEAAEAALRTGRPGVRGGLEAAGRADRPGRAARDSLTQTEEVFAPRSYKLERLGRETSLGKERLARMEANAARYIEPTGVVGAEDLTLPEGAGHIGYPRRVSVRKQTVKLSSGQTIGHSRDAAFRPSHGESVRYGLEEPNVGKILASRGHAANKLKLLHRRVTLARRGGTATPTRKDDVFVWNDGEILSQDRLPPDVKDYLNDPEKFEGTPEEEKSLIEQAKAAFVRPNWQTDPESAKILQAAAEGKGVFVHRSALGDLAKPLPTRIEGKAGTILDTTNNVQKALLIYLKANYLVVQALSNTAMNFIQQGPAAPVNIVRAGRLMRSDPELAGQLGDIMGTGALMQLAGESGKGSRAAEVSAAATQKLAHWMGGKVDGPARLSAILHELDMEGYRTPAQIKSLIENDSKADTLGEIAQRAKESIVDYGEMSQTEQALIRRMFFVYPWLKGSTKYAGHFLRDHPIQAAVLSQIAHSGQREFEQTGLELPSYLEGAFLSGGKSGGLVNPSGVNPLQTPVSIAQTLAGTITGNPVAPEGAQFLTPAIATALGLLTRRNTLGIPLKGSLPSALRQILVDPTFAAQLARAGARTAGADVTRKGDLSNPVLASLLGPRTASRSFPDPNDPYWRFFFGGLYPRPYDEGALRRSAALERSAQ